MYKTPITLQKPVIAAVDNYAVGIGMQLFLMCDWRIATNRSKIILPELANGLSCTLGAHIISEICSIAVMQSIVYGCKKLSIKEAMNLKIIHEIVDPDALITLSIKRAKIMSNFPSTAFSNTKQVARTTILKMLDKAAAATKNACKEAFSSGDPQIFMKNIIKNKK